MALRLPKSIFIHTPKTGGTWVTRVLEKAGLVSSPAKKPHAALPETLYDEPSWHELKAFTFVRHPFTWYQSFWAYKMKNGWDNANVLDVQCGAFTFEQFIRNVLDKRPGHLSARYRGLTAGVDFIGRFETLRDSLVEILSQIGETFDPKVIRSEPDYNVASRDPVMASMCRYPGDLLKELCKTEAYAFRTFGYNPDEQP